MVGLEMRSRVTGLTYYVLGKCRAVCCEGRDRNEAMSTVTCDEISHIYIDTCCTNGPFHANKS